jgi:hypothetical protein
MTSSYTSNKSLEKPGNGDYVDTWNIPVNADMDVIDQALGGATNLNATSGSATLSATQYRSLLIGVTGAMSASVVYTIPSGVGGQWIVRNATTDATGGPWTVTVASGGGGSSVAIDRNVNAIIFSDGTNIRVVDPVVGNNSITNAKLATVATQILKGRSTAGVGNVEDLSITQVLDFLSSTQGSILYRGASAWLALAPGVLGQLLSSGGPSANPAWVSKSFATTSYSNLKIDVTSDTAATVTANSLSLVSGADSVILNNFSGSIATGTSGLNGLDSGSIASNTWYSVWVISNGSLSGCLLSTSATAPVMPSGYTYKMRVGWVRYVATGLARTIQRNDTAQYKIVAASQTPNYPIIASGAAGSVDTPTWVAADVTAYVPTSTASQIIMGLSSAYNVMVNPNDLAGGRTSSTNPPFANSNGYGAYTTINVQMGLESSSIYWASNYSTTNCIAAHGWVDNL